MHPSCVVELPHACIHNGIAGLSLTPHLKQPIPFIPSWSSWWDDDCSERALRDMWKSREDLLEELTPDQLIDPGQDIKAGYPPPFGQCAQGSMNGPNPDVSPAHHLRSLRVSALDAGAGD
jgi:hypothetical protein